MSDISNLKWNYVHAQNHQETRMTVYSWDQASKPTMNGWYTCENSEMPSFFCLLIDGISRRYPVYQSSVTGDYLYLYDWGKGLGMNWFISTKVKIVVVFCDFTSLTENRNKLFMKIRWLTITEALKVQIWKRLTTAVQKRWCQFLMKMNIVSF